jgi:hypothetical protein
MKEVKTGHFVQCHFGGELTFEIPKVPKFESVVKTAEEASTA